MQTRGRKMKWPFSKHKSETELELERLDNERKLNEAKLKRAEVDDTVIAAVKVNALFNKLREGCNSEEEFERRLEHYSMTAGMDVEYLKQEFSFKRGVRRLESMDEKQIVKLERMMNLDKEHKKALGWTK